MHRHWMAIAFVTCAGCAGEVVSRAPAQSAGPQVAGKGEPLVGRLKTRDRTIDLTMSAFGPGRTDVPREATAAKVMADIDLDTRSQGAARYDAFDARR